MERKRQVGTRSYTKVAKSKLDDVRRKQRPDLDSQGVSSVLDVPQHRRDYHNHQTDPEEDKKTPEVAVVTVGIKVR
jgi:hypothetical protein